MRVRFVTLATVAALALATVEASTASAQATSQRRIPRSGKGAPADTMTSRAPMTTPAVDSAAMRRDSVARAEQMATQMRADSMARMAQMRADSMARVEQMRSDSLARMAQMRADSMARADSMMRAREMMGGRRNFFVGIAAGPSFPVSDYKDIYNRGFNVLVPIGLQTRLGIAGLRLDLTYNRFTPEDGIIVGGDDVDAENLNMYGATLNATAGVPFGGFSNFYVFGGGGVSRLDRFIDSRPFETADVATNPILREGKRTLGHVDGGVGVNFGFGGLGLFLEGRYVSVFQPGTNFNFVPVSLGLRF